MSHLFALKSYIAESERHRKTESRNRTLEEDGNEEAIEFSEYVVY